MFSQELSVFGQELDKFQLSFADSLMCLKELERMTGFFGKLFEKFNVQQGNLYHQEINKSNMKQLVDILIDGSLICIKEDEQDLLRSCLQSLQILVYHLEDIWSSREDFKRIPKLMEILNKTPICLTTEIIIILGNIFIDSSNCI